MTVSLSSHLFSRCRVVLLKCSQFENQTILKSVFVVGELKAYRDSIPEANNKEDRVDYLLSYLMGKELADGRPALSLFLTILRERYQGQELYDELGMLYSEVEQEFTEIVDLPVVVMAMSNKEAQTLFTETIFRHPAVAPQSQDRFQRFKNALADHGIIEWTNLYNTEREDWHPAMDQNRTIKEIIQDAAIWVDQKRGELPGSSMIRPKFVSDSFFSEDYDVRTKTWQQLRYSGCVLIVDAISLYHPTLRERLHQSQLSASENIAMLIMSPVNPVAIPVNQIIEDEFSFHLEWAYTRFAKQWDRLCEFGIGDVRALQRWLSVTLSETANNAQKQVAKPINRGLIRKIVGEPQGMEQLIFGRGDL